MNSDQLESAKEVLSQFRDNMRRLKREIWALLVEDNASDIAFFRHNLEGFKVQLDLALTARAAIEKLGKIHFDVVLLDLRLDTDSGLDVLRVSRDMRIETMFIVLTGADESNPLIKEALNEGAKFVLQKPVTREHLNLIFGTL